MILTLCLEEVEVHQVQVEAGLHEAGHNHDDVVAVLHVEPVQPVHQGQHPVHPQGQQIEARDGLRLPRSGDGVELRDESHRLQEHGEGEEYLHGIGMVWCVGWGTYVIEYNKNSLKSLCLSNTKVTTVFFDANIESKNLPP